jgi:hypothetical protein
MAAKQLWLDKVRQDINNTIHDHIPLQGIKTMPYQKFTGIIPDQYLEAKYALRNLDDKNSN